MSGCRRERIEDSKQSVAIALGIPGNEFGVIEVITGIHFHAIRQTTTHDDFFVFIEQTDFDAVNFFDIAGNHFKRCFKRCIKIIRPPIVLQLDRKSTRLNSSHRT